VTGELTGSRYVVLGDFDDDGINGMPATKAALAITAKAAWSGRSLAASITMVSPIFLLGAGLANNRIGDDMLKGGDANDLLSGNSGSDIMNCRHDNDVIIG
jgi:Ca2+-binding RTX toxin-like protein